MQSELEFSSTVRCQHVEDESGETEESEDGSSEAEDNVGEEAIIENDQPSFEAQG